MCVLCGAGRARPELEQRTLTVTQDPARGLLQGRSKAAGLALKPACERCYFYSLRDHFSRTL